MLDEYMISLGFNSNQIKIIKQSYKLSGNSDSNILFNLRNISNFFHENNINNDDLIKIISTIPSIVSMSVENIKLRVNELTNFGFTKNETFNIIVNYPYILIIPIQKLKNKYKFFGEYNFNDNDINSIIITNPSILNIDNYLIKKRFSLLESLGYGKVQIIKLVTSVPAVIDCNFNEIKNRFDKISKLGFSKKETILITTYMPDALIDKEGTITDRLEIFYKYGISSMDIIKIIKRIPIILSDDYLNSLDSRIKYIIKLGFDKNYISNLINGYPYILLLNSDLINYNVTKLTKNGIDINMIQECPILIGYCSSVLKERINYYRSIDALFIIKNNSNFLMYSIDLIKNRYDYICKHTDTIDLNDLFINDNLFKKKYNVTRHNLLGGGK